MSLSLELNKFEEFLRIYIPVYIICMFVFILTPTAYATFVYYFLNCFFSIK